MRLTNKLICLLVGLLAMLKLAAASDFLPAWQAFQVQLQPQNQQSLWLKMDIADEYHIYKDKIKIQVQPDSQVQLGTPLWPDPMELKSPGLGTFLVYEKQTNIQVPISHYGNGQLHVIVKYQGCKNLDLCFPEQSQDFKLNLSQPKPASPQVEATASVEVAATSDFTSLFAGNVSAATVAAFFQHNPLLVISAFFALGLLIAFTPCVFPLLPVLIGVIAGPNISTRRSFSLAFSYIVGGACMYMLAGIVAASLGYSLAAWLQASWIYYVLASLFTVFALAMFDVFTLQLPPSVQNRLNQAMAKRQSGSLISAFTIGAIANLVLSPCVTAPLAGALVYISTTGDRFLGGASLFALGLGSGLPLLVIAVFGKRLLPKSGTWMLMVKKVLAFIMLAMAIYMLSKTLAPTIINALEALWLLAFTSILLSVWLARWRWHKPLAASLAVAFTVVVGLANGWGRQLGSNQAPEFVAVTSLAQLEQQLTYAKAHNQPVLLDFYADWCVACKEMDLQTFSNPQVAGLLGNYYKIRVDVTANSQQSQQLQQHYQVIAPPSLVFVDKQGAVQNDYKVTGFIASHDLATSLQNFSRQQTGRTCGSKTVNC